MHKLALLSYCSLLLAGCYESPVPAGDDALSLSVPKTPLQANGSDTLDVLLSTRSDTAPGTVVHLEVSSGVVNFGVDPATPEARQVDVKLGGAGAAVVPLRVGLTPGKLLVRATAGDITRSDVIDVSPAGVEQLALSTDRGRVHADGLTPINVTVRLSASGAGTHVSEGTPVYFAICCSDDDQNPTACVEPPFLSIPQFATAIANDIVTTTAIPSSSEDSGAGGSSGAAEIGYFIIADVEAAPSCNTPSGSLHASRRVALIMSQ